MKVVFDTPEEAQKHFDKLYKNHEGEIQKEFNDRLFGMFTVRIKMKIDVLDDVLNIHYGLNGCNIYMFISNDFIQFPETLDKIRELFDEVTKNDNPL